MSVPAPPPVNPALAGQSHLAQIMGVETVFIFLVVTISGLRLYTRLTVTKGLGIDDWTMAGASVGTFSLFILHPDTIDRVGVVRSTVAPAWAAERETSCG